MKCCSCRAWFEVTLMNNGVDFLCFCPVCGHEFEEAELAAMRAAAEESGS